MIEILAGLPRGVIGFEASGTVTGDEYREVLEPAFEDAAVGLRHWSSWKRIAIVTDKGSVGTAVHWLGWLIPGDVRVYDPDQLSDAKAWILEP